MGVRIRALCLLPLVLGSVLHCSALKHDHVNKNPLAMVVGTVYCDTCFHKEFTKSSHFISGALVSVQCGDSMTKLSFQKEVRTNWHGVFRVRLPLRVGRHVDRIESCSVKLIRSNEPFCAVAAAASSSVLQLKSKRKKVHVFSAGYFTFKPLKQPELCSQKPAVADHKLDKPAFFLPSPPQIPLVPSPPNIGGIPLPPNPLQPPPSVLPPLPLQPSPPPLISIPPLPFIAPPPPPPAFRLPPLLFPPNPLFPGIPLAFPAKNKSP